MRSNYCLTILHVSILALLVLTLDADSEDSKCETEMKVRRNTVYKASVGRDLRIKCTVTFCNNSPPKIFWYKLGKNSLPVNVSSDSHIKTNWTLLTHSEGISSLIFKNILSNDSGLYQCQSGGTMSHTINVSVYDNHEFTTVTWTTLELSTLPDSENPTQDSFWRFVYRIVGIMMSVIIVIAVYVARKSLCKGVHCVRKSRTKTDPDPENRAGGSNPGSSSS